MNIQRDTARARTAESIAQPQFALPTIDQSAVVKVTSTFTGGTDFTVPAGIAGASVKIALPVSPIMGANGKTGSKGNSTLTIAGLLATTLATEVVFVDSGDVTGLSNGEYMVDYESGYIYGKRADAATAGTIAYTYLSKTASAGGSAPASVVVGGVYNPTLPTLTAGQEGELQLTVNGSVLVRSDAYDTASQSDRGNEVAPLNQQFINETLINTTNVAAATNYYPSTAGVAMDGYKTLSIQGVTSGGVTTTVEATNDDAASPAWVDVTLAFNNLMTGATSAATQVDTSFLLSPTLGNVLNVKALRIKSVTSDATNAVLYAIRRVSL